MVFLDRITFTSSFYDFHTGFYYWKLSFDEKFISAVMVIVPNPFNWKSFAVNSYSYDSLTVAVPRAVVRTVRIPPDKLIPTDKISGPALK